MKRRVLRAHANKRRLRILSAEHGLCLDTYNILCDASFLRAVSHAICSNSFSAGGGGGVGTGGNTGNERGNRSVGGARETPARALKSLMHETFAAATSNTTQGNSEPSNKARPRGVTLTLYYLPETAVALRRIVQREESTMGSSGSGLSEERARNTSAKPRGRGASGSLGAVAEALLKGIACVGRRGETAAAEESRNEGKAVAQFADDVAAGRTHGYSLHGGKNANFFFVATQSHDVRRLLPTDAALIRLTTMPTALWIERNGNAFHYEGTGNNSAKARKANDGRNSGSSSFQAGGAEPGHKGLSEADAAFMRYLSGDLVPRSDTRHRSHSEGGAELAAAGALQADRQKGGRGGAGGSGGTTASGAALRGGKHFRRRKVRGPNPLSVKKKSKRETLRVDISGSQRKKMRKE